MILFAVIVGLLTLFALRILQPGTRPVAQMMDLRAAQRALEERYPMAAFEVKFSPSSNDRRNLVVRVKPGPETRDPDAMLDHVVSIITDEVRLSEIDSLLVFLDNSSARAVALHQQR